MYWTVTERYYFSLLDFTQDGQRAVSSTLHDQDRVVGVASVPISMSFLRASILRLKMRMNLFCLSKTMITLRMFKVTKSLSMVSSSRVVCGGHDTFSNRITSVHR
eukprot:SAG31_NODE_1143_length_9694_cov_5.541011_8_plen_105_part_00